MDGTAVWVCFCGKTSITLTLLLGAPRPLHCIWPNEWVWREESSMAVWARRTTRHLRRKREGWRLDFSAAEFISAAHGTASLYFTAWSYNSSKNPDELLLASQMNISSLCFWVLCSVGTSHFILIFCFFALVFKMFWYVLKQWIKIILWNTFSTCNCCSFNKIKWLYCGRNICISWDNSCHLNNCQYSIKCFNVVDRFILNSQSL